MAKWFIGQRVKLARPSVPEHFGCTGFIHSFEFQEKGTECADGLLDTDTDCTVMWDGQTVECCQLLSQLEPILPNGAKPSEFVSVKDLLDSITKEKVAV